MAQERDNLSEFSIKKKVDESWKDSVNKEKGGSASAAPPPPPPSSNFSLFISSLGMQVLMALGEAVDPEAPQTPADLGQAKYLIDILQMISGKTKGNLSAEENEILENLLYELRVKFVEKSKAL